MTYERITVTPYGGALGAEISGVDLNDPLDDQTYNEIKQALLDNCVIFFRDQDITPDKQTDFGRRFGELDIHPFIPCLPGHKEIIQLQADSGKEERLRLSNEWHVDLSYTDNPPLAAILRGVDIPTRGGDTMWVNLYEAYETLSEPIKRMISELNVVHDLCKTYRRADLLEEAGRKMYEHSTLKAPPIAHPIVQTHPETGKKLLYVSELTTTHIEGLHPNESDAILNMLYEHINWKELHCRFYWEPNSIAMWDNRCTAHYAVRNYTEAREMHRVTVLGKTFNA